MGRSERAQPWLDLHIGVDVVLLGGVAAVGRELDRAKTASLPLEHERSDPDEGGHDRVRNEEWDHGRPEQAVERQKPRVDQDGSPDEQEPAEPGVHEEPRLAKARTLMRTYRSDEDLE